MRIGYVTFEYPPNIIGGGGIHADKVTQELSRLGHQVTVFTPGTGLKEESINNNGIIIKRINLYGWLPFKALQFWLRLPKSIKDAEKAGGFDVVHINGFSYNFLKKKISKGVHVLTVHHLVKDATKTNDPGLISRIVNTSGENGLLYAFVEKRIINCADRIIAVSNFTKKSIMDAYGIPQDKIHVVYNGIELEKAPFTEKELEETKKRFSIPDKPIILFVGRINDPRKGLDLLVEAYTKVLEKIDATLLVVGSGDRTNISRYAEKNGIRDRIIFTGFVDDITLKKCYAICDVYACPSRLEGFGLTILEAIAYNKPIVATRVGAIPEIMGEHGILVDPENVGALSEAIISTLNGMTLKEADLNRINDFTWSNAAKKTLDVYGGLNGR